MSINNLLLKLWRMVKGRRQWYLTWLIHPKFVIGVSGVVFNNEGYILLLRHRFWKPGSWGLPGGYANRSERLEHTLIREIREETGYRAQTLSLLHMVSGYRLRLEVSFIGRIVGGTEKLDPREILEARFFDPHELPEGLLYSHKQIIRLALSQQQETQQISPSS
ncbi:MAG TPA: NUDIX domain-containing protein [Dictyobacter sp.]|jgi:8-oxo-dGTP pyrophosphatase MutT (NUDIX family)|nr:NUDIX domain-containing protein [Dictyobacter sp.]